jgi:hypothetical protein
MPNERYQYELKTNLKAAAYRDFGAKADQVDAGNHSHAQLDQAAVRITPMCTPMG